MLIGRPSVVFAGLGLVTAFVALCWTPAAAQIEPAGRKLALLVGVKAYDHGGLRDLEYSENDVVELADLLKPQGFEVVVLTTGLAKNDPTRDPTADNIRKRLTDLLEHRKVTKRDVVLVGLAGHGIQPLGSKEAYFCPRDANPTIDGDKPQKPETLLAMAQILKQLDDSGVGHKLLLVDACRNDPSVRGRRGVERVDVSALPPQTGVLLSCAPGEFSFEHKSFGGGHGAFFFQVLEGLRGGAKDEDGEVTWESLRSFVRKRVPVKVHEVFGTNGGEQQPNEIGNLLGTPTVLVRITDADQSKLAEAMLQAGRLQDAIDLLQRLLSQQPRASKFHKLLGIALSRARQLPEAIEHFRLALKFEPDQISALKELAVALADVGQTDEAIAVAEHALSLAKSQREKAEAARIEEWLGKIRTSSRSR